MPDPQSWGLGGGACWKDPGGKRQPSRASRHHPLSLLHWVPTVPGNLLTAVSRHTQSYNSIRTVQEPTDICPCTRAFKCAHTHTSNTTCTLHTPMTCSPEHTTTRASAPSPAHPVSLHHWSHKPPPHTHGFLQSPQNSRKQCHTCPVTWTHITSLGVYNCPKQSRWSWFLGAGLFVPPTCVCSSGHWGELHFIPALSLLQSCNSPGCGRGLGNITPEAMPSHKPAPPSPDMGKKSKIHQWLM